MGQKQKANKRKRITKKVENNNIIREDNVQSEDKTVYDFLNNINRRKCESYNMAFYNSSCNYCSCFEICLVCIRSGKIGILEDRLFCNGNYV